MNVPQLRFSGYDGEWEETFVKDTFSEVRNGFVGTATPFYVEEGIPYLQSNNVKNNKINKKKMIYINEEFHKKNKKSILRKNDIVMVQSGHAGECAVIEEEFVGANCHALIVMTPNSNTNAHFFSYYINSPLGQKKLYKLITGNTIRHILASDIKKYDIKMPGKEEQLKISSFLSLLERRIEKQQEKIENLEQLKKGIMQKIFSQELRFKDVDGREFPEWEEKLLSQISVINPKTEPLQEQFYYIDLESVDKGRVGDLKTVNIDGAPSRAQRVLMKDDVLFQTVRPYQQNHFYVEEMSDKQLVASTGFAQIRTNQSSRYIYYLVHTEEFSQEVLNRCTGTSYPAINSSDLGAISVPVPFIEEQKKIGDFLFSLDKKINKEKEKMMVLEMQKKGFMWGMFV